MGNIDYTGEDITVSSLENNKIIFETKIARYNRNNDTVFIAMKKFELKNDEVYKFIIYANKVHSCFGRTRGLTLDNNMEISLFNFEELDIRKDERFRIEKNAVIIRVKDAGDKMLAEKKINIKLLDISKNGIMMCVDSMELEIGYSFDFLIILDSVHMKRLNATVMRKSLNEYKEYVYGCGLNNIS